MERNRRKFVHAILSAASLLMLAVGIYLFMQQIATQAPGSAGAF